jgi:transcriptional regulator with XRE-family HTH domain
MSSMKDSRIKSILKASNFLKALAMADHTASTFADKLGCTRQYVSAIMNGRSKVSKEKADAISKKLKVQTPKIFKKLNENSYEAI